MTDASGRLDKAGLRVALLDAYPWLAATEVGPQSVDAGECDRCGNEARILATCGPVAWVALGRRCAAEVGLDAWCDGHADDGEAALAWAYRLPPEADEVARVWWIATGEVRWDPGAVAPDPELPAEVLALLSGKGPR